MSSRRVSTRSRRAQSTSSLQPPSPERFSSSQPNIRIVQPSPGPAQRATQPARAQIHNESVITALFPVPITDHNEENVQSPLCPVVVTDNIKALCCDQCLTWYHADCLFILDDEYHRMSQSEDKWYCDNCRSIQK